MRLGMICFWMVITLKAAWADEIMQAVTYRGTIGSLPVIVELAGSDPDHFEAGRYAYMAKGIDIPLHRVKGGENGVWVVQEEKPCTPELCKTSSGEVVANAPMGAQWELKAEQECARLTGTWRDLENGKVLPITLERKEQRNISVDSSSDLLETLPLQSWDFDDNVVLKPAMSPYDFLKMDYPSIKGKSDKQGNIIYRIDTDPRTQIEYLVIEKLGLADLEPVNAYLHQSRLRLELMSYDCWSKAYLGFGWSDGLGEGSMGFDGGTSFTIDHITNRLMGFHLGGSYYCGGGHLHNFIDYYVVDVQTGQPIEPMHLLKDWVAKDKNGETIELSKLKNINNLTFRTNDKLVDYVLKHSEEFMGKVDDCQLKERVHTNLGIYFTQTELVFALRNMENQLPCEDDLFSIPIKDARFLLTEKGAQYFEVLDQ